MNQEEIIGGVVTNVGQITDNVVTGVTGVTGGVISGVTGGVGSGITQISGGIGGAIGGPIGTVIGGVGGVAGGVIGGVGGLAGDLVGGVGGLAGDAISGVTGAIGSGIDSITSGLAGAPPVPELPPLPGSGGENDPCNRLDYLKERLGMAPLIGNLSLKDIGISLDNIAMPSIPEIKIPSPGDIIKDIGDGITGGISDLAGDLKAGIGGALDELSPGNLMDKAKSAIGSAGREALAGAIEDGITDMLGPVKAGLGNQLKRSFKQNMLMLGVEEVANIISGEPNILDPCAGRGKEKIKGITGDAVAAAKGGSALAGLKGKLDSAMSPENMSLKELAHAQTPVLGDMSLPNASALFDAQTVANDTLTAAKTDQVIDDFAKETATKAVVEDAAAEETITVEELFPEPEPAAEGFYDMYWRSDGVSMNDAGPMTGDVFIDKMNENREAMKELFKSKKSSPPHEWWMLNETVITVNLYIKQLRTLPGLGNLPQGDLFIGGLSVRTECRGANGQVNLGRPVESSDVASDYTDGSYINRVYEVGGDSGPYGDVYPGRYYGQNINATLPVGTLGFMTDNVWKQQLNTDSRIILKHINRVLSKKEAGEREYLRDTLVWTSLDSCVEELVDWFMDYPLTIPKSRKDFGYQGGDFRPVDGEYQIPDEYCAKASLMDLMAHEMIARVRGNEVDKVYKPTKKRSEELKAVEEMYKTAEGNNPYEEI